MSSNITKSIPDLNLPAEICQTNTQQVLSNKDVSIGFIAPGDTENLLFEQHMHQVEVPAQDPPTGFTAPISRDGTCNM